MQIRPERQSDIPSIRAVNQAAFNTSAEADVVDALRERAQRLVSLVADDDGTIVGHIMFSPVWQSSSMLGLCAGDRARSGTTPHSQRFNAGQRHRRHEQRRSRADEAFDGCPF